jgi:hypothetical protein
LGKPIIRYVPALASLCLLLACDEGGGDLVGSTQSDPNAASAVAAAATAPSDAALAGQISPGQVLPYGEVATVCGLDASTQGVAIDEGSGFVLYDTNPAVVTPRTQYISGFPDGCPRQFTASLALFGDVGTHEVVRYQPSNSEIPYSETDVAYEEIKARICGVPSGQPCGAELNRLGRNTVFVTVYETFGTNPTWAEILIHDGQVVAMDRKND